MPIHFGINKLFNQTQTSSARLLSRLLYTPAFYAICILQSQQPQNSPKRPKNGRFSKGQFKIWRLLGVRLEPKESAHPLARRKSAAWSKDRPFLEQIPYHSIQTYSNFDSVVIKDSIRYHKMALASTISLFSLKSAYLFIFFSNLLFY